MSKQFDPNARPQILLSRVTPGRTAYHDTRQARGGKPFTAARYAPLSQQL